MVKALKEGEEYCTMLLKELGKGSAVVLELIWGNMNYKIKTQVIDTDETGILIPALMYDGVALDASSKVFQEMRFNLYGNGVDDQRICWKNLKLSNVQRERGKYYHLTVSVFNQHGGMNDQRGEKRIPMGLSAEIHIVNAESDNSFEALLKDISNEGAAIFLDERLELVGTKLDLSFADEIREHTFELRGRYQCLRIVQQEDGGYVYGLKLLEGSRDLLAYIYLKRLINEKK